MTIGFRAGLPIALNGREMGPADLLRAANALGARHGVGRADIVENRVVGMKSRGVYETPGGTVLFKAAQALDSLTLDRLALALKDELAREYGRLVYDGLLFHRSRLAAEAAIRSLTSDNEGEVRLRLYKGSVEVVGRSSRNSLYQQEMASFEDDPQAGYDQADAAGFIRLVSLPMRIAGALQRRNRNRPETVTD